MIKMLHILKGRKVLYCGLFSTLFDSDKLLDSPTARRILEEHDVTKDTGLGRLFYMFSTE